LKGWRDLRRDGASAIADTYLRIVSEPRFTRGKQTIDTESRRP
jgi:hypothetical protein